MPARATAGTISLSLTTGDAPDSICPYAWRLPRYEGDNSYTYLVLAHTGANKLDNDTSILMSPTAFIRAGQYLSNQSAGGYYFSATIHDTLRNDFTKRLYITKSTLTIDGYWRGYGLSLRCLAR